MFRNAKKLVLIPLLTVFLCFSLSAYDGTVIQSSRIGSYAENVFIKAVSNDIKMVKSILKEAFPDNPTDIVFQLKYENLDDDNSQVIGDIENYIFSQYKVSDKDTFFHIIMKNNTKSLADGWVIYSNYESEDGFAHIIYYFSLR